MSESDSSDNPNQIRLLRHAMVPLATEDGARRQFGPYEPIINACEVCPARCCHWTVRCSIADVVRYLGTLALPYRSGFTFIRGDSDESWPVDVAPDDSADAIDPTQAVDFVLHRRDDGSCANLVDHGGHLRCSVYAARPTTCRLYPVSWESKERQGGGQVIFCPVPYGVTPSRETQLRADIEWSLEGWKLHREILEEYRAASFDEPRTADHVARFAIPRAAERLGYDPAPMLVTRPLAALTNEAMMKAGLIR